MHGEPMAESEGESRDDWKPSDRACPYCGVRGRRYYKLWESSDGGYEDEEDECRACGKVWWIEGPDA